jgi:hypothetical protein
MIAWLRNLPIYQEPAHLTAPTRRSHPPPGRPDPGAIAQIASPNGHRHRHSKRATPIGDLEQAAHSYEVLTGLGLGRRFFIRFRPSSTITWDFGKIPGA